MLSLVIQGAFCYLIEYFCANYFLNSGYTMPNAGASSAPIGDMMKIVGTWAFGSAKAGVAFMVVQAVTVFLALIGTTLACLNTGARVTYAMGRDEEMGAHFGMLHEKTLSPHKAIWTLGMHLHRHRHHHRAPFGMAATAPTWRRWTSTTSGIASASSRRMPTPSCPTRC